MKKLLISLAFCGLILMPHDACAYEGNVTGTTEVSYKASKMVIVAPVEVVTVPKTDDNHEVTEYLLAISGSILLFLILLYRREEEKIY